MAGVFRADEQQKEEELAHHVYSTLLAVSCPLVEYLCLQDADGMLQLLCTPSQLRTEILTWICSCIKPEIATSVEPAVADLDPDAVIREIALVGQELMLCRASDLNLIKGEVRPLRQLLFLQQLLTLVSKPEDSEYTHITDSTEEDEEYALEEYALEEYALEEYAPEEYAPEEYAPEEYAPEEYALEEYAPEEYAPEEYAPEEYAPEENAAEENAAEENAAEENAAEENAAEENAAEENAAEENAAEENAAEEYAPEEYAPEEYAPEEYAPEEYAPEENAPEENAPEENAPEEDAPEEDAPEENAPEENAPEENAAEEYAAEEYAPEEYAPEEYAAEEYAPEEYAPEEYAPEEYAPEEDAPEEDAPEEDAPEEDAPEEDAPEEDTREEDAPEEDAPEEDAPEEDAPEEDAPEEDAPEEDAREEDAPEQYSFSVGAPEDYAPEENAAEEYALEEYAPEEDAPEGYAFEEYAPEGYAFEEDAIKEDSANETGIKETVTAEDTQEVQDQYDLVDELFKSHNLPLLTQMLKPELPPWPADIQKICDEMCCDLPAGAAAAADVEAALQSTQSELERLRSQCDFLSKAAQAAVFCPSSLRVAACDLQQLMATFSHVYESDLKDHCDRAPPSFSADSQVFQRVQQLLLTFNMELQIPKEVSEVSAYVAEEVKQLQTKPEYWSGGVKHTLPEQLEELRTLISDYISLVQASS